MALYETKGTLSFKSEVTSGVSQSSGKGWSRMSILLDTPGFQGAITKQSFNVSGDLVEDVLSFPLGAQVKVAWVIYAREWNGKYYNNVDLVRIEDANVQQQAAPASAPASKPNAAPSRKTQQAAAPAQEDLDTAKHPDDLPF